MRGKETLLHLDREMLCLRKLFVDQTVLPSNVHIFGGSSCGKTSAIKQFFEPFKIANFYIDCVECCRSDRKLFELILNNMSSKRKGARDCSNANEFLLQFNEAFAQLKSNSGVVLIFDNVECLRVVKPESLPVIFRLQEIAGVNVCIVTIGKLPWSHFSWQNSFASVSPVQIYFSAYSKDQLVDILCQHRPDDFKNVQMFRLFAQYLLEVYFMPCPDLNELLYLTKKNVRHLQEFVESGENNGIRKSEKLWPFLQKRFSLDSGRLYRRGCNELIGVSDQHCYLDLPLKTKFLLISAYMASYNTLKADAKFLLKKSDKCRKSAKAKFDESKSQHLRGPKVFSLERMLIIYTQISEEKFQPDDSLISQVSTLCSLRLVQKCSNCQFLDIVKYKCLAPYSVVKTIAKSVDFELNHYLNDFNQ